MSKLTLNAGLCLIIASLATITPTTTGVPVSFCSGKTDGLYPHSDTTQYYSCDKNQTSVHLIKEFCQGKGDGNYVHPQRNYFFMCSNQITHEQICAGKNVHFVLKENACVWIDESNNPDNEVSVTAPVDDFCENKSGMFAHPKDPSKFYYCANGNEGPINCPSGLVFDTKLLVCVFPSK